MEICEEGIINPLLELYIVICPLVLRILLCSPMSFQNFVQNMRNSNEDFNFVLGSSTVRVDPSVPEKHSNGILGSYPRSTSKRGVAQFSDTAVFYRNAAVGTKSSQLVWW